MHNFHEISPSWNCSGGSMKVKNPRRESRDKRRQHTKYTQFKKSEKKEKSLWVDDDDDKWKEKVSHLVSVDDGEEPSRVSVLFNHTRAEALDELRNFFFEIYLCARLRDIIFIMLFAHRREEIRGTEKVNIAAGRKMRRRRKTVANYGREQHKFRDWENASQLSVLDVRAFFLPSKRIIMRRARIMFRE